MQCEGRESVWLKEKVVWLMRHIVGGKRVPLDVSADGLVGYTLGLEYDGVLAGCGLMGELQGMRGGAGFIGRRGLRECCCSADGTIQCALFGAALENKVSKQWSTVWW